MAFGAEPLKVEFDRLPHATLDLFPCGAGCDAALNVRRVGRKADWSLLYNNKDLHHLRPACLSMLFKVPGARSSLGLPATVTNPGFV